MKPAGSKALLLAVTLFAVATLGAFPAVAATRSPGAPSGVGTEVVRPAITSALSQFQSYSGDVGYVTGVIGLAGVSAASSSGSVSISISGIPSGSTVLGAYLFWDVVDSYFPGDYSSLTFASHSITGTSLGGTTPGDDPCYTSPYDDGTAPTYVADVTSYVTGNGGYAISESWPLVGWYNLPFADGLGLVVVYSNPSLPNTVISLADGFGVTNEVYGSETSTLSLSTAASGTFAQTTYIIGDGQNFYAGDANILFQGTTVLTNSYYDGPSSSNDPSDPYAFFAAYTIDVTSLVPSGTTSVSFGNTLVGDCLVHMAQVFQYAPTSVITTTSTTTSSTTITTTTTTTIPSVPEFGVPVFILAALIFPALLLLRFSFRRRSVQTKQ